MVDISPGLGFVPPEAFLIPMDRRLQRFRVLSNDWIN